MTAPGARRSQAGRPAQIGREQIVACALDAGNLDTLTMRELAARLGVSHGALYRWVPSRDALLDMASEVLVDRVLDRAGILPGIRWRDWLAGLAWAMHDEFLAVPGYATRTSRPHRHNPSSFGRLRAAVVGVFVRAGVPGDLAEQSWYIFGTSVVGWLAARENAVDLDSPEPDFALFIGCLMRGLPAREPSCPQPGKGR